MVSIPDGILTALTTAFDADGLLDTAALRHHIDWLLDAGVHALIPGGTTGEFYAQSTAERAEILEVVTDAMRGRVPLLAGVNSTHTHETLELASYAHDLGYVGLLVAAPPYSLPSEDALVDHVKRIAGETGMPIMLYNFPARTGVDMTTAFLRRLVDVPEVVAIKESSGSIAKLHELVVDLDNRFTPVCGTDDQALEFFLWGARSWVAGASNFVPQAHVRLYETAVVKGDIEGARALMRLLLPLFSLLENSGKYVQYVKAGTQAMGMAVGAPRPPLCQLSDAERATLDGLLGGLREHGLV